MIEQEEAPTPTGIEVLIRVKAAGLGHFDLHIWESHSDLGDGKQLSFAERGIKLPLNHEICGEVVAAGREAADARLGMSAIVHP